MDLLQGVLFHDLVALPRGFACRAHFLTRAEEAALMGYVEDLPLVHPETDGYEAKRRIFGFGWSYDFENERLLPGAPLPPFLQPLARKVAKWMDIPAARVVEALITEYPPGSAIGWHRDNERFEHVIGVSLAGRAELRLRPIASRRDAGPRTAQEIHAITLPTRSAYALSGESRWEFQHSVAPVESLRYSITLRTLPKDFPL